MNPQEFNYLTNAVMRPISLHVSISNCVTNTHNQSAKNSIHTAVYFWKTLLMQVTQHLQKTDSCARTKAIPRNSEKTLLKNSRNVLPVDIWPRKTGPAMADEKSCYRVRGSSFCNAELIHRPPCLKRN